MVAGRRAGPPERFDIVELPVRTCVLAAGAFRASYGWTART